MKRQESVNGTWWKAGTLAIVLMAVVVVALTVLQFTAPPAQAATPYVR
jgi:hypothetical protein